MTSSGQTVLTLEIPSSTVDDCGQFVCEGSSGELLRMATGNLLVTGNLLCCFNVILCIALLTIVPTHQHSQ